MAKSTTERRKFIHDRYLPNAFILCDPHNIKLEELQKLLKFLFDRQQSNVPAAVFRFCAFRSSRKGSEITPTIYPDEIDLENPPTIRKKPKRQKRAIVVNQRTNASCEAVADANANADVNTVPVHASEQPRFRLDDPNLLTFTPTPEPDKSAFRGHLAAEKEPDCGYNVLENPTAPNIMSGRDQRPVTGFHTPGKHHTPIGNILPNPVPVPYAMSVPQQILPTDWNRYLGSNEIFGVNTQDDLVWDMGWHNRPDIELPELTGSYPYATSTDGIDYGVPLNVQTRETDDENLPACSDHAGCQVPNFSTMSGPTHSIGFFQGGHYPNQDMYNDIGYSLNSQVEHPNNIQVTNTDLHTIMLRNVQMHQLLVSQVDSSSNAIHGSTDVGAESAEGLTPCQQNIDAQVQVQQVCSPHMQRQQEPGRSKRHVRTADDLAADEAVIVNTKRRRLPRVRDS